MRIDPQLIRRKFGDDYAADQRTFVMGIDRRFTKHFAERFEGANTLETCTGAGFTTLALARTAIHVFTVEIDEAHQTSAISNIEKAGLSSKVTFLLGDILDPKILRELPPIDAAFIDPDWAVTGPDHEYRFRQSNTQPPADLLLQHTLNTTENVAIVLPPFVKKAEFQGLQDHECEKLYLNENHELYCLYFGKLKRLVGKTEFRVTD